MSLNNTLKREALEFSCIGLPNNDEVTVGLYVTVAVGPRNVKGPH